MRIFGHFRLALLGACLLSLTSAGFGQAVYGSLYGTVTDNTGAVIPNATVTVTDAAKGTSVTATSNASGGYTVEHMIPDLYNIKVTAQGFKTFETKGIQVYADQSPRVDAALVVGGTDQTVEVNSDTIPELKTDRADVSTVFNAMTTEDLPLAGRNFTGLQLLLPGTQLLGWSHASSENPQGSQQIMVNGQHFAGVSYELDGTDNQDPILGIIVINPSLDSVTESKIATQNYDAQFGKAVAAVVTAQTKSGSNSFHGGLFDYRVSDANSAKNPYNFPDSVTKRIVPKNLYNEFGAHVGGPILHDKLFFFSDYQGQRQKVGTSTGQLNVPTKLLKTSCAAGACDFSEYVANNNNQPIYDPSSQGTVPFAHNIIPSSKLNPQAVALLEQFPNPIVAGTVNNFSGVGTGLFNSDQATARLDGQLSEKIHAFGRYTLFNDLLSGGTVFGALGGLGFGTGGFGGTSKSHDQSLALGADAAINPKLLTDVRIGYFRYAINTSKYDGNTPFATNAGIPGLNTGTGNTGGAPGFFVDGLAAFGSGLGVNRCNCPLIEDEHEVQFVNNWTKIAGNHSFKVGADFRHAFNLRVPSDANRAGELGFSASKTNSAAGQGGVGLATFVLGQVSQLNRFVSVSTTANEFQNRFFLYAQDTWRATPSLTINYGLRWENYFPEYVNAKGNGSILNLKTGDLQVAGYGNYGSNMGVSNYYHAFAPRVGVTYQIDPKTVIRAGYGRSFDIGVFGSIFGHAVTQNLPVLARQNSNSSGFSNAFVLGQAPPTVTFPAVPSNGNIPLPNGVTGNARPLTERFPTIDAWNLSIERELGHSYTLTMAYVGNKGTHTFAGNGPTTDPNQVALIANGLAYNPPNAPGSLIGVNPSLPISNNGDNNRRRYFATYGWTQGINYFSNHADTHFNALQAILDKHFSNGYQFQANYAWQRAFNYDGDYFEIDKRVNYGRSSDLREQQLTTYGNYELPFGHNKHFAASLPKAADLLIAGWEVSNVLGLSTGLPYTPNYQDCGADRDTGPCKPNLLTGFKTGIQSFDPVTKSRRFYTPTAELKTNGAAGGGFSRPAFDTFGNIGRNELFGPHFFNMDLAVQKSFNIYESVSALFRMDAFNVFNHISPGNPGNTCIDCSIGSGAGLVNGMAIGQNPRQLTFTARLSF